MSKLLRCYLASQISQKHPQHALEKLNGSIRSANVALNPHQIDAAVFAFNSPISRGAILADEVGLGKTIEAGLILNQLWVEGKRKILILVPASLRTQWVDELRDRFGLDSILIDGAKLQKLIKETQSFNPFDNKEGGIYIASHNFGSSQKYEMYVKKTAWDLIVIDEAHRMRNVYRRGNKTAKRLRDNIQGRPKILLTATPLQNNLMELYGLVSFIDEKILGTAYSFRTLYQKSRNGADLSLLRERLMGKFDQQTGTVEGGVLTRTLRKQVKGLVKFTQRHCITEDFTPEKNEIDLYDGISEYLGRPYLASMLATQRNMMELVYRKILASSSYAIAGTLEKVAQFLAKKLQLEFSVSQKDLQAIADQVLQEELKKRRSPIEPVTIEKAIKKEIVDPTQVLPLEDTEINLGDLSEMEEETQIDAEAEISDDLGEDEDVDDKDEVEKQEDKKESIPKTGHQFTEEEVKAEFNYILHYLFLAKSIQKNMKGEALVRALSRIFKFNHKQGWPEKVVIFTESRRTQDYLERLLTQKGFEGIVLFNGTNASQKAKDAYAEWAKEFPEEAAQNSKSINQRRALVWKFRQPESHMLITTEAGAEGLNLQFANVVINYDLPWNPQRVEQRIGRCHRYGQELDVLVVNFLNQTNYADKRIYELLREKIKLFGNLFDFGDKILGTEVITDDGYDVREVALGSLDSGVGFEKKILGILKNFRSDKEIKQQFDQLQLELSHEIDLKFENAHRKVIQHFDEEVRQKLQIRGKDIRDALSRYDKHMQAYVTLAFRKGWREIAPRYYKLSTIPDELQHLSAKELAITYSVGEISPEDQERGIIQLSSRSEILRPYLAKDRTSRALAGKAILHPQNTHTDWFGCEGQIVVHRLHCEQQNANNGKEEFEDFVYSGIIKTVDGWKIIESSEQLKRLIDPASTEWKSIVESSVRIRDDLKDVLKKNIDIKKQEIEDKNEAYIDRQRDILQQYAKDQLLRNQREMQEKQNEIETKEKQLKTTRTIGAHERRQIRDEIDKKQKDFLKSQERFFEAQKQAFKEKDHDLALLKKRLNLAITPEHLLTLQFKISNK